MAGLIQVRLPAAVTNEERPTFVDLEETFLESAWYVTHSSLSMWKSSRNVKIQYKKRSDGRVDDCLTYQPLDAKNIKTLAGIDTPDKDATGAWTWRGNGWLKLITSHWEVLGHGTAEDGKKWAVTYFDATMFTSAGIDVYCSDPAGLTEQALEEIKTTLRKLENETITKLVDEIFEVVRDDGN